MRNAWGAAGATMGTGAGVASALLFMLFVYGVNKKTINKRLARDTNSRDEATGEVMKNIVLIVMPIILSSFIYNVNGFINSYMYSGIQGFKGIDHDTITSLYAEYGYYMTLINIPLTLASTAPTSMIPEVSAQYAKHDIDSARDKIDRLPGSACLFPFHVQLVLQSLPDRLPGFCSQERKGQQRS